MYIQETRVSLSVISRWKSHKQPSVRPAVELAADNTSPQACCPRIGDGTNGTFGYSYKGDFRPKTRYAVSGFAMHSPAYKLLEYVTKIVVAQVDNVFTICAESREERSKPRAMQDPLWCQ